MKNLIWVVMTLLLACNCVLAQSLSSARSGQLQLSLQNGVSSLLASSSLDSVYFTKAGYQAGIEGNYFWNSFGLSGSAGYFSHATDRQSLEDFALKRKAPRDRVQYSTGNYKGIYLFTGPAFQSTFNKWRVQSSLEGGIISKPSSQVFIKDVASPDVVYYKNVFDDGNSFAWSAGFSVSYSLTRQLLLGVNADYVNTKNEVVNYDIFRGNGQNAKNITSQAGFLNTGIRLSYLFNNIKSREAGSGLATGKRTTNAVDNNENGNLNSVASNAGKSTNNNSDTCRCQDQVMEVHEMQPYVVEIQFATVQEARTFLDTYQPLLERREAGSGMATGKRMASANSNPLYKEAGNKGENPLYESKRTISNAQGSRGMVHVDAQGRQAFYLLPTAIDLGEILSLQDGRVTVHVQANASKVSDFGMSRREAGSGMATGKRTYKAIAVGDVDGDGRMDLMLQSSDKMQPASTRDITNDPELSWGSIVAAGDVDGDGFDDYYLQSAGNGNYQYANEVITAREAGSGMATGKRQARDVSTGLSTGRRQHKPMAIGDLDGDGMTDMLLLSFGYEVKAPRDVATGQASGKRSKIDAFTIKQVMVKEDVYVWKLNFAGDVDGDGVPDAFVCSGNNKDAKLEKATSGIKQTMQTQVFVTLDNDDPTDEPTNPPTQKAGISTSRSNLRTKQLMSCGDGSCVMLCELELDGQIYSALITSRTKHDTAKNAIGNIR